METETYQLIQPHAYHSAATNDAGHKFSLRKNSWSSDGKTLIEALPPEQPSDFVLSPILGAPSFRVPTLQVPTSLVFVVLGRFLIMQLLMVLSE